MPSSSFTGAPAIGFHAMRGELGMALPLNLVLLGLSLFVL